MQTNDIPYEADGETMVGTLAVPTGGAVGPAVLVAHEGFGMTDNARVRAVRLAQLGYAAFAFDYHGGGRTVTPDVGMARLNAWRDDPAGIRARARKGLEILCATPGVDAGRVGAIGYCFGGAAILELARTGADLKAVVGFHPGLQTTRQAESRNIKGSVLMLVGADDPFAPLEHRNAFEQEMEAAGVDWRMVLYGAGVQHSFTSPEARGETPGIAYHGLTDRRSWRAMLDLFAETIGAP